MGRWQNNLESMPKSLVTKPTQHSFGSFVSSNLVSITKNKVVLIDFVTRSCNGIKVKPQQVIDYLLSVDDEQSLIDGETSENALKLHIEHWMLQGMPDYSGKNE